MSKLIYDEVMEIIVDSFINPQDENDDCYMFNRNQLRKISRAITIAQKQHELLELYEELAHTRLLLLNETDINKVQTLKNRDKVISKTIDDKELENE